MSAATFTLRIERERPEPMPEDVGRLLSEAESLISDGLPEGWYAKIEDAPRQHSPECDLDEDCDCEDWDYDFPSGNESIRPSKTHTWYGEGYIPR